MIRNPCTYGLLLLSHHIYERIATEYPTQCGMQGKSGRDIHLEVRRDVNALVSAIEPEIDPGKTKKRMRLVQVRPPSLNSHDSFRSR
jgi:hypothetical protein